MILTLIILGIIAFMVFIWWEEESVSCALFAGFFATMVGFIIMLIAVALAPTSSVSEREYPLRAIATHQETGWSFFLLAGGSRSDNTYEYLQDQGGYFVRRSVKVERAHIYASDTPKVVYVQEHVGAWWLAWGWEFPRVSNRTQLHVPDNSITTVMEVTL